MDAIVKKWIIKGLEAVKAQEVRKRTKDVDDSDVVDMCTRRIAEIDGVINVVMTKELFNEPAQKK